MVVVDTYTNHYSLIKPRFDKSTWHDDINGDLDKIDTLINAAANFPLFDSAWTNATHYSVGTRVYDTTDPGIWQAVVDNTSAASGTFAQDRATNPTNWVFVDTGLTFRGEWAFATSYVVGDVVTDTDENILAICAISHLSTIGIRTDSAKWTFIVDFGAVMASFQEKVQEHAVVVLVAGTVAIPSGTTLVILNLASPGTVTLQLPTVAAQAGITIKITDWTGNVTTINATPSGSEKLSNASGTINLGGSAGAGVGLAFGLELVPIIALSGWIV